MREKPEFDNKLQDLVLATRAQRVWDGRQKSNPLEALLEHSFNTVPFYRDLASLRCGKARTAGNRNLIQFEDLPLIDRAAIARTPERFRSDVFGTGDIVEFCTSGTSGVPLKVWLDFGAYYGFVYETYRRIFKQIKGLGGACAAGCEAVLVINDNPQRADKVQVSPTLDYALVRRVIIGRSEAADRQLLESVCDRCPPLFCGRPRSLLRFTQLVSALPKARRERIRPRAVFSSGDNLYDQDRSTIQACFGARVHNGYASQEAGLVAMDCPLGRMHVLHDRVIVEIVRNPKECACSEGYGELVVTNLENWAMPFIRYRTNDMAKVERGDCSCGFSGATIATMDGRESTYFVILGRRLNPSVLNPVFEELPIAQFQMLQTDASKFELKWVASTGLDNTEWVQRELQRVIGNTVLPAELSVTKVMNIGNPGQKVQRYVRDMRS